MRKPPLRFVGYAPSNAECPSCGRRTWATFRRWDPRGGYVPQLLIDADDHYPGPLRVDECFACGATLSNGGE